MAQMDGVRQYQGNELAMEREHVNLSILVSSWRIQENVRHSIPWMCDKSRNYWAGVIWIGNDQMLGLDTKGSPNLVNSQPMD
mmetsp:Transcript_35282/g.74430  ORF Transcript_35282/g.74430 Transcript_35282/m.74430 type:complete len:82 (-) Transcript_35282:234-479(-)